MSLTRDIARIFYEPGVRPRRLSLARCVSLPCSILGLILIYVGAVHSYDPEKIYLGLGITAFAIVLHTLVEWRRVKFGSVAEIERDEDGINVGVHRGGGDGTP